MAALAIAVLSTSTAYGQGTTDPGVPTIPDTGNVGNNNNNNNDSATTSNVSDGGEADVGIGIEDDKLVSVTDDQRNQGFVGATAIDVQEAGFSGVSSDTSGSAPSEGANFGGGVNGSGGGNRAGGGRGAGGAGAGNANGFVVSRRSLRAKVRPRFSFTPVSSQQVSDRFNNSFYRLPQSQNFSGQYQVSVQNKKATVTGSVSTKDDMDRVIRQLRLQPGVYSIDNQLQIQN